MIQRSRHSLFIPMVLFAVACTVVAEAPIDVERKAAQGDFLSALASFDRMSRRVDTAASVLAASRSAWALGLPDRALQLFDIALRREDLTDLDRARALFSKGTIYYQTERYQLALMAADQTLASLLIPSPLRGSVLLLKAQILGELGQFPSAVTVLQQAQPEVEAELQGEFNYHYGRALARVGRFSEAKEALRLISTTHERAADGIKQLISIADDERDYSRAAHWVRQGRELFPDQFLDGRYDYMLAAAIQARNLSGELSSEESMRAYADLRKSASAKLAPSDPWLALIVAVDEQHRRTSKEVVRASFGMQPFVSASAPALQKPIDAQAAHDRTVEPSMSHQARADSVFLAPDSNQQPATEPAVVEQRSLPPAQVISAPVEAAVSVRPAHSSSTAPLAIQIMEVRRE